VTRATLAVLAAGAALALGACGGDDDKDTTSAAAAPTTTEAAPTTTAAPAAEEGAAPEVSGKVGEKPTIAKASGSPPAELVSEDIEKGDGATAKEGDKVSVQYVGQSFSTGQEFDASWNRGEPFEFTLGAGEVIPGWDEGVAGMKEGGRRELVIPPDLAYGAEGSPPAIGPNETLVFVIDLEKLSK
jgi:peptidylprolyl isomerase